MSIATVVVKDAANEEFAFSVEQQRVGQAEPLVRQAVTEWCGHDKAPHEVTGTGRAFGRRIVVQLVKDGRSAFCGEQLLKQMLQDQGLPVCSQRPGRDYSAIEEHADTGLLRAVPAGDD